MSGLCGVVEAILLVEMASNLLTMKAELRLSLSFMWAPERLAPLDGGVLGK